MVKEFETVHHRHAQICEKDVKALCEEITEPLFAVARGDDFGPDLPEQAAHRQTRRRMVFHDQDSVFL
jgi:hypothetical protein